MLKKVVLGEALVRSDPTNNLLNNPCICAWVIRRRLFREPIFGELNFGGRKVLRYFYFCVLV